MLIVLMNAARSSGIVRKWRVELEIYVASDIKVHRFDDFLMNY